jgi:ubiquinone/menaquinone biosynthesis C-methylase UbiE
VDSVKNRSVQIKKECLEAYNEESKIYDAKRSFYETGYGGYRERKLLSLISRGGRVLDLACGTGRLLRFQAERNFEVVALDLSRGMIKVAKGKTKNYKNVNFIIGDAETLPFRNASFDEVVCSRAFKFFPNPLRALNEQSRVLKDKGMSILSIESSDPIWMKIGYRLKIPFLISRFESRYHLKDIRILYEKANFKVLFSRCVLYFGKPIYVVADKYFRPFLHFLELIDSHSKVGRNTMIVGIKMGNAYK